MSSSLIRGKYIIGRVIDKDQAEVIEDGAIFQRDVPKRSSFVGLRGLKHIRRNIYDIGLPIKSPFWVREAPPLRG
jgi:hypothetical protein